MHRLTDAATSSRPEPSAKATVSCCVPNGTGHLGSWGQNILGRALAAPWEPVASHFFNLLNYLVCKR